MSSPVSSRKSLFPAVFLSAVFLFSPLIMQLLYGRYTAHAANYAAGRYEYDFLYYFLPVIYGVLAAWTAREAFRLPEKDRLIFSAVILVIGILFLLPGFLRSGLYLSETSGFPAFLVGEENAAAYRTHIFPLQLTGTGGMLGLFLSVFFRKKRS